MAEKIWTGARSDAVVLAKAIKELASYLYARRIGHGAAMLFRRRSSKTL